MAKHRSVIVEDGEGNKASVWVLDQKVDGLDLPQDVWNELYRRARKAGWLEDKIEPYVWQGKSLVMLQKEPNAGKVKILSPDEADPKLKGQDKVIVELLERTRFLEEKLKEAEAAKAEAPAEKKAPVKEAEVVVTGKVSPEAEAFLGLQWKKAIKEVQEGKFDSLLNEVSQPPAVGFLKASVQKAVQERLKVVSNG